MLQRFSAALRARLVDDARFAWRFWSVRLAGAGAALMAALASFPGLWAALPDDAKALVPHQAQAIVPALLLAATVAARLAKQGDGR